MRLEDVPKSYIIRAIENCLEQGIDFFNRERGFGRPKRYPLIYLDEELSTKAIASEAKNLYFRSKNMQPVHGGNSAGWKQDDSVARAFQSLGFLILDKHTGLEAGFLQENRVDEQIAETNDTDSNLLREAHRLSTKEINNLRNELGDLQPSPLERTYAFRRRRNAYVRALALKRANGICELKFCEAPFMLPSMAPFLEVHHIDRLSDDGFDHVSNVAAVCPNCHREIHSGIEGRHLNERLRRLRLSDSNGIG